jgi:hypothetical protein
MLLTSSAALSPGKQPAYLFSDVVEAREVFVLSATHVHAAAVDPVEASKPGHRPDWSVDPKCVCRLAYKRTAAVQKGRVFNL